jgi:hypothetical protein
VFVLEQSGIPLRETLVKNIACLPRVLVAAGRLSAGCNVMQPAENFIRNLLHRSPRKETYLPLLHRYSSVFPAKLSTSRMQRKGSASRACAWREKPTIKRFPDLQQPSSASQEGTLESSAISLGGELWRLLLVNSRKRLSPHNPCYNQRRSRSTFAYKSKKSGRKQ